MIDEFKSIEELYQRISPALKTKVREFIVEKEVTEKEIWNFLSKKWKDDKHLTLFDIVDDIMKLKLEELETEGEELWKRRITERKKHY